MSDYSMTLDEYQSLAVKTDRTNLVTSRLSLPILGLFGETGSLLSEVKKKQRDSQSYDTYENGVVEEFGDTLWYLAIIAHHANLRLSDLVSENNRTAALHIRFVNLQPQAGLPLSAPSTAFERTLLKLATAVGKLAGNDMDDFQNSTLSLRDMLSGVLDTLIDAANEAGVTLEDAAIRNIEKAQDRWPTNRTPPPLFDIDFPQEEQLPRQLEIEIFERESAGKMYVYQRCRGVNIGDRLTDNNVVEDFYRFHDVFHYAYAAVLGWSPVTRALLKLKRKSKTKIDDGEDGARAGIIEEGVVAYVFSRAKEHNFFEGRNELDFTMLKVARSFVKGFEAENCPLWLWEEAILKGNAAFRFLQMKRRGLLVLDLDKRDMIVQELPL
ncbi:nucleoside triphosphate pyrophosphohydrolase family protein [Microvirga pudoricolor]|uniref:nucleoside triphosphate pyrophosphohydrolase family protein n=1 Tax=Microvirga pudoricolor TaxID=2778729 RepID=UPI0019501EB2|nr:nucleoside triphosphate pyrophosphohydrolase family protein [Microvirga pudoricolor]MBM6596525.1 nucleoside triphosphate pyrophosphohydrolase family protein [Microvirga pudoricolor]